MSDAVSISIITGVNGLLTLIVGGWLKSRQDRNIKLTTDEHQKTRAEIEVVRNDVNDKMQQLIESRHAEGVSEGRRQVESENQKG